MKISFGIVFVIVVKMTCFGQKVLLHECPNNESYFEVLPYQDGSFSIFSAAFSLDGRTKMQGVFRTYDQEGNLLLEKPLLNSLQFGLSRPQKARMKGVEMVKPYYLYDSKRKKTFTVGFSTTKLHCRILNEKGELDDIAIKGKELGGKYSEVIAYRLSESGDVQLVIRNEKLVFPRLAWVHIDIKTRKTTVKDLKDHILSGAYGLLRMVGSNKNGLYLINDDGKADSHAILVRIDDNGELTKLDLNLRGSEHMNHLIVEKLECLGSDDSEFYFTMRPIGSSNYFVYKLNEDHQIDSFMEWAASQELINKQKKEFGLLIEVPYSQFCSPFLMLNRLFNKDCLVYSYMGMDLNIIDIDKENMLVESSDQEVYFSKIDIEGSRLNVIPFLEMTSTFEDVLSEISNKDLHSVRTLYNGDGTFGFLTITGEKLKFNSYTNIKITKYV